MAASCFCLLLPMESKWLQSSSSSAVAQWTNLPTELLTVISGCLQNPHDIIRFRSVCRSWRFSISPFSPSPFFPRTILFSGEEIRPITLIAGAIYLVRPRRDPSKPWMVSVQESDAGKLLLRHPLTYEKIAVLPARAIDSSEWSVTQLTISYGYNKNCGSCDQIETTEKVDLVQKFNSGGSGSPIGDPDTILIAIYRDHWQRVHKWEFNPSMIRSATSASESSVGELTCEIEDFVEFSGGTFYAIDTNCSLYEFNHHELQLNQLECSNVLEGSSAKPYQKRLIVSDGALYMILRFCSQFDNPPECQIYKLLRKNDSTRTDQWKRIENLGDKVFFINRDCSFSVSARDLGRPWKGNCVVFEKEGFSLCACFENDNEIEVFQFGTQLPRFSLISMLPGYSDLFTPLMPLP